VAIPGLHQAWHVAIDVIAAGRVAVHYSGSTDAPTRPFPDDGTCRSADPVTDAVLFNGCSAYEAGARAYSHATWNAYLTVSTDALSPDPTWYSAQLNPVGDPLVVGECSSFRCQQEYEFTDVRINPKDGSAWAAYVDACDTRRHCDSVGRAQLARLVGLDLRASG
jgi:hypothetical protein